MHSFRRQYIIENENIYKYMPLTQGPILGDLSHVTHVLKIFLHIRLTLMDIAQRTLRYTFTKPCGKELC